MKEDSKELYERKMKKRSVTVIITDYHKESNSFIGTVTFSANKTLQEILLEESYVYVDREGAPRPEYKEAEKRGRASEKGVWTPSLAKFEPVNPLDLQEKRFKGKFSWV
jgi:endonuclease YncB( thermonuclease family)